MGKVRAIVPLLMVITLGSAASEVRADPVQLTSGSLYFSSRFPAQIHDATGSDGTVIRLIVGEHRYLGFNPDVTPGEPVNLSFSFSEVDDPSSDLLFFGSLTQNGIINALRGLDFTIMAGSILVPDSPLAGSEIIRVDAQTPFSFRGVATIEDPSGAFREISLFGSGRAVIDLMGFNDGPIFFGAGYRFEEMAATPEPGSLLLFATGAAAVARLRRRKPHNDHSSNGSH